MGITGSGNRTDDILTMKGMEEKNTGLQVAVLGLGYVGCVSAACLADMGHKVTGIDRDANKISNVMNGIAPFFEPGSKLW